MPRKSRGAKSARRSSSPRRGRHLWLAYVLVIALVGLASWVLWVDYTVRAKFEGTRWALAARVYARPLELYAGLPLSAEEFVSELDTLGYRKVQRLNRPGEYTYTGKAVALRTRGFAFWDGAEPSRLLRLRFGARQLVDLKGGQGDTGPLTLVRLEPFEIARIYPNHNEDRVLVKIKEVPSRLIEALLAVEDRAFYQHLGINLKAIARAMIANVRAGSIRQGGSTLTQQLVKNFYLSQERTLGRKITEMVMALLLEGHYSKDEILEAYLNEIYLGQDGPRAIHGFGLAAQFYFGLPLNELETHQLALLAGLARGASYYDPRRHPERALQRRNHVLEVMMAQGLLNEGEGRKLMRESLGVTKLPRSSGSKFPAFMDLVRRQLARDYREEDLRTAGLQIFTTLDPQKQRNAEQALSSRLSRLEKQRGWPNGRLQGAIVVTGTQTGEILALVGDRDPRYAGFNRALEAKRPIGSLVKPAVYLAALSHPERYHVLTPLNDTPLKLKNRQGAIWVPHNYNRAFHGTVPLHRALAQSYNLATVRLGMDMGIAEIGQTLRELGVEGAIPAYPSMLLGAIDLSPFEVTQMYQTLASGGFYTPLRAIREVLTAEAKPLKRYGLAIQQAVPPAPGFLINHLLAEVVREGTARELRAELPTAMPLAGKTGTTNDLRDSWFAGFGGDVLAVAWIGRDDNRPAGLSGASGAMRVWADVMKRISPSPVNLTPPAGIEWRWIDRLSGKQTDPECPGADVYPFMSSSRGLDYQLCDSVDSQETGLTGTVPYQLQ